MMMQIVDVKYQKEEINAVGSTTMDAVNHQHLVKLAQWLLLLAAKKKYVIQKLENALIHILVVLVVV